MRGLNKKQKILLDKWFIENKNLSGLGVFDLEKCDSFSSELLIELTALNDFEIINSAINNYIQELANKGN